MSHWLLVYPKILSNFGARWYVVSSLSHLALLFCKISINASGLPSWHCYSYCKVTPRRRLYCKAYVALAPHWRQGLFSCTHPLSRFSAILLSVATSWQHQQAPGTGGIQNRDKYALTRQKPKLYLLRLKVATSHLEREDRSWFKADIFRAPCDCKHEDMQWWMRQNSGALFPALVVVVDVDVVVEEDVEEVVAEALDGQGKIMEHKPSTRSKASRRKTLVILRRVSSCILRLMTTFCNSNVLAVENSTAQSRPWVLTSICASAENCTNKSESSNAPRVASIMQANNIWRFTDNSVVVTPWTLKTCKQYRHQVQTSPLGEGEGKRSLQEQFQPELKK